jgi:hypothetical protein
MEEDDDGVTYVFDGKLITTPRKKSFVSVETQTDDDQSHDVTKTPTASCGCTIM